MFEFLKPRPPQSYHWSESRNRMVPCASTPCRRHPSDVVVTSEREAENAHRLAVRIAEEKVSGMASEDGAGLTDARDTAPEVDDLINENTYRDPNAYVKPVEHPDESGFIMYDDHTRMIDTPVHLFRGAGAVALSPSCSIAINGRRFGIGVSWNNYRGVVGTYNPHEIDDACESYGMTPERFNEGMPSISPYCYQCHGTGKAHGGICDVCDGYGFRSYLAMPPAASLMWMPTRNDGDKRIRDFAREHPREVNGFIVRALRGGTYMADDGEYAIYRKWSDKDIAPMILDEPDRALSLMRDTSDEYQEFLDGQTDKTTIFDGRMRSNPRSFPSLDYFRPTRRRKTNPNNDFESYKLNYTVVGRKATFTSKRTNTPMCYYEFIDGSLYDIPHYSNDGSPKSVSLRDPDPRAMETNRNIPVIIDSHYDDPYKYTVNREYCVKYDKFLPALHFDRDGRVTAMVSKMEGEYDGYPPYSYEFLKEHGLRS